MHNLSEAGDEWWSRFQAMLDDQVDWPSDYMFKFIVPSASLDALKMIFGRIPVRIRVSNKGNYVSVTAKMEMHSSEEVIAVYSAAAKVEGVISL